MRSREATPIIPPFNDEIYPFKAFPPWQALMRVLQRIADVLGRREQPKTLRLVEVRLFQAGKRVFQLSCGELTPAQWHRRVCIAIDRLEQAKRAALDYASAEKITPAEAQALIAAIDDTIARLGEATAQVPLPEDCVH